MAKENNFKTEAAAVEKTRKVGFWKRIFGKGSEIIEGLDLGADTMLLYTLFKGNKRGGTSSDGKPLSPQAETSNRYGLGDIDEGRLLATYGSDFTPEEIQSINKIWSRLEPHQTEQIRIRLTALKHTQVEASKNPDALTLKGLAKAEKELGTEEAVALLLKQGIITLHTKSEQALHAFARLTGLDLKDSHSFKEIDSAIAIKIRAFTDKHLSGSKTNESTEEDRPSLVRWLLRKTQLGAYQTPYTPPFFVRWLLRKIGLGANQTSHTPTLRRGKRNKT